MKLGNQILVGLAALAALSASRPALQNADVDAPLNRLRAGVESMRMPRSMTNSAVDPGADTCDMATDVGVIPPNYTDEALVLAPGDHEWRTFRLTSSRAIHIETVGDPEGADTNLTLWKRCEDGIPALPLAFNEDRSVTDFTSRIPTQGTMCLRADTYFVDTGSYIDGGTAASFDLLIVDEGPCTLPGADRYEPDDDPAQAKPLRLHAFGCDRRARHAVTQARTIDPEGDLDFAKFRLPFPTRVRLSAGSNENVNTVMGIADPATGEFVAVNDDTAVGSFGAGIETCLPSGEWLVAVVGRTFPDVFRYQLVGAAGGRCAFESEPNDSPAAANPLRVRCGERATIHGQRTLAATGQDSDFYRFRVARRSGVIVETRGYDSFRVDTKLELYDAAGTLVEANDDGGAGWLSRIERNLDAGIYFVKVTGSPVELPPLLAWVYQLNLTVSDPFPLEEEPNDVCGEETPVGEDEHLLAGIAPIGDIDRYELDLGGGANGGVLLDIAVTSLGDPVMRLYDDPGSCTTAIACDDDSGPGLDPRIQCCVPAAGTYSLEVRDFLDNHAIPFYSLDVKTLGACVPSGPCPTPPDQLGCR